MAVCDTISPVRTVVPGKKNAISKINRKIEEEHVKMAKCHQRIGEKYAQLHPHDYEEEFSDLIRYLDVSRKKLADYSVQMQFVTGIILCANCGHKAPEGSVFCNMCGSRLPEFHFENYEMCENCCTLVKKGTASCPSCSLPVKQQESSLVKCARCGESVGRDNRLCPICGEVLFRDAFGTDTDVTQTARICPNPACGAFMSFDKLFCTECGTKLK